ncbi:MAG: hypothetical protein P8R42_14555 [Candidatus Binatia bacterium]|nr:hypothetical protein [Candidatus Binatia bacterium]
MGNHLHLIVEAQSELALSRGRQGLLIRIARALNKLMGRRGKVFTGRFHSRVLRTGREIQNALAYVLCNARKHGLARNGPRAKRASRRTSAAGPRARRWSKQRCSRTW